MVRVLVALSACIAAVVANPLPTAAPVRANAVVEREAMASPEPQYPVGFGAQPISGMNPDGEAVYGGSGYIFIDAASGGLGGVIKPSNLGAEGHLAGAIGDLGFGKVAEGTLGGEISPSGAEGCAGGALGPAGATICLPNPAPTSPPGQVPRV